VVTVTVLTCRFVIGCSEERRQLGAGGSRSPELRPSTDRHNVLTFDVDVLSNDASVYRRLVDDRLTLMMSLTVACLIRR